MTDLVRFLRQNILWVFYAIFVAVAIMHRSDQALFTSDGPYAIGKPLAWLFLVLFLIYSLRIHFKENFFRALGRMKPILWSRQIGLDLYLGLLFPLTLIYLNEASLLILALWFVPIFVFANLATFLYIALNYDSLIAHFV